METECNLDLHPEAAKNFDQRANELLSHVAPVPHRQGGGPPFRPEVFSAATITEKDIVGGLQTFASMDYQGMVVEMHFARENQLIGLTGERFKDLLTVAESLQRTGSLRDRVSQEFVLKNSFQWLRERYERTTNVAFSPYVIGRAGKALAPSRFGYQYSAFISSHNSLSGRSPFGP